MDSMEDSLFNCETISSDRTSWVNWFCRKIKIDGLVCEFGVWQGRSVDIIAKSLPDRKIYGFDSFVGLQEDWKRSERDVYKKGHFDIGGKKPNVQNNVELIKGFFNESLPQFLDDHADEFALIHIDSDTYESAKSVLCISNERIKKGTIIVFDEICDFKGKGAYPNWRNGEYKALIEWLQNFGRLIKPIGRTNNYAASFEVLN